MQPDYGPVEIQLMTDGGYDREFSSTVTAASAIIGPIIPPSNIMIIYAGCVGTVSVGKMFLAGAIPGVLLGIAYMILCYFISLKRNYPCRQKRASLQEIFHATIQTLPALFLPILIMGSIISGICTATEASALAVVYSAIVAICKAAINDKVVLPGLYQIGKVCGKCAVYYCDCHSNGLGDHNLGCCSGADQLLYAVY